MSHSCSSKTCKTCQDIHAHHHICQYCKHIMTEVNPTPKPQIEPFWPKPFKTSLVTEPIDVSLLSLDDDDTVGCDDEAASTSGYGTPKSFHGPTDNMDQQDDNTLDNLSGRSSMSNDDLSESNLSYPSSILSGVEDDQVLYE